jgi:hypothetical protein
MVIDLIQNLANQVMRERLFSYGSFHLTSLDRSSDAMLMASGQDLLKALGIVSDVKTIDADGLSWARSVAYGIHPVKLWQSGARLKNPYRTDDDHGLSDPLHLAAFYAVYGDVEAAKLIMEHRAELLASFARWQAQKVPEFFTDPVMGRVDWGKWMSDRCMTRTWVLPDFEEMKLKRVPMHATLDSFYLEGAFESESYTKHLKRKLGPQNIEAVAMIAGLKRRPMPLALRAAAFDQARKLCTDTKGGSFRYSDMAVYIRLCEPPRAADLFDSLRGARQMVTLFRSDTNETHYMMGLRALAQAAPGVRKEILERLGRAPTIDEVRAVRSIGIINVLDEMDWSLIEPLTKQPGLRAAALPYAEKLGPVVLRRFLSDHPARVKLLPSIETDAATAGRSLRITDASSIADWETVIERLHALSVRSLQVREALRSVTENDAVSFLALLPAHKASSPDIDAAMRAHPRWEQIEKVLVGYTPPDLNTLWR